jgi:hypothetical protein
MQHASATGKMLEEILGGCTNPDPAQHGMTTEEERAASDVQVRDKTHTMQLSDVVSMSMTNKLDAGLGHVVTAHQVCLRRRTNNYSMACAAPASLIMAM